MEAHLHKFRNQKYFPFICSLKFDLVVIYGIREIESKIFFFYTKPFRQPFFKVNNGTCKYDTIKILMNQKGTITQEQVKWTQLCALICKVFIASPIQLALFQTGSFFKI